MRDVPRGYRNESAPMKRNEEKNTQVKDCVVSKLQECLTENAIQFNLSAGVMVIVKCSH